MRMARQKNLRLPYYVANLLRFSLPDGIWRARREQILGRLRDRDAEAVLDRVHYYNKIAERFALDPARPVFRFSFLRGPRNYYMDLHEYLRYFDPRLKVHFLFGDIATVPEVPTIVKARPLVPGNANSVLFNLNKIRHYVFAKDGLDFEQKIDKLVWRGNAKQENRKQFLARFYGHERCDVGHAHRKNRNSPWTRGYLGISGQLKYKFILSLEGNDVASNLKWIMSSNSLCFMARPQRETWFMEGRLAPGFHYVLLKDDFSDLEEQMDHYLSCPDEAREIIRNANRHVDQFRDRELERLVSLLVLEKYFEMSGQVPGAGKGMEREGRG